VRICLHHHHIEEDELEALNQEKKKTISLRWNYEKRWLDISMPGYIKTQLLKYERIMQ